MESITTVGIAGDWHGMLPVALNAVTTFHAYGIKNIYHVGDFGIHSHQSGQQYIHRLNDLLVSHDMRIFITPGNHENYDYLETIKTTALDLQWITSNIAVMPRGYRWEIAGRSFASLGGAASIDYLSRQQGINWWAQEAITLHDLEMLGNGGNSDVLITHDAPLGGKSVEMVKAETQEDWLSAELLYSYQSQRMVTLAVELVEPKMVFHGHYHHGYFEDVAYKNLSGEVFGVRLTGMAQNGSHKNLGILNPETLEFVWIDQRSPYQKERYPDNYLPLT